MDAESEEADVRLVEARRILAEAGIDAPIRAEGLEGEIAAVTGPSTLRELLARVAPALRELGFRYVALEPDNERGQPERDT